MHVRLILQPFEHNLSLHEVLTDALASPEFNDLLVVVAWAKDSGFRRLRESIASFRERGGHARIILGVDEGGATIEGLNAAMVEFDEADVVYDSSSGTFHPKIYCIAGTHSAVLVVGSSNFTAGGLFRNYEASAVLDLDLAIEADAKVLESIRTYASELRGDGTSVRLDETLKNALETTPFFRVSREGSRHGTSTSESEDSFGTPAAESENEDLFGKSFFRKKRDPSGRSSRSSRSASAASGSTTSGGELPGASEEGGSTAELLIRWTKKLTRSDCGSPREGSNTTGALRFTKAGHAIDQATWFHDELFVDADWAADHSRPGRQRANVRFEVRINGVERGTHPLELKYDARREADQNNFTTDLKWGPLSQVVRSEDLTGQWVAVERLEDGTMRIEVTGEEPIAVVTRDDP